MGTMTSIRKSAQRYLKGIIIILVVALAAGVFYVGVGSAKDPSKANLYKGPSAAVDGKKISDKDFNSLLSQKRVEFMQWGGAVSEELIRDITLEDAINQQIMKNAQQKMGIRVSEGDVKKFIDKLRKRYPTEEEWTQLMYQTGSESERALRGKIREYLVFEKFILELAKQAKMTVSDDQLAKSYESVEASHILIKVKSSADEKDGHTDAEALRMINEIYAQIQGGADFAELAKAKSEDPGSKEQGGSLGFIERGQMVAPFEEAAFGLKAGEMSKPVKTSFGYHIVKVTNRREAKGEEFDSVKADLRNQLLMQKYQSEKFNEWHEKQKKAAKVEILDPAMRAYRLKTDQKWKEAAAAYEKAIKRQKKNVDLYLSLADVYRQDKQFAKAAELLEKARKQWPTDFRVVFSLAESYAGAKNKSKVAEILVLAGKQSGNDVAKHQEIKRIYELAGMKKEADNTQKLIDKFMADQQQAQPQGGETESGSND